MTAMEEILFVQHPAQANDPSFVEYNAFAGFLQTSHAPKNAFPKANSAPKPEPLFWPSLYWKP